MCCDNTQRIVLPKKNKLIHCHFKASFNHDARSKFARNKKRTTAMERIIVENNNAWGRQKCFEPCVQQINQTNHHTKIYSANFALNNEPSRILDRPTHYPKHAQDV